MTLALAERVAAIYLPLLAALELGITRGRRPRQFPACLLSLLWAACSLLALQCVNQVFGWWSFANSDKLFCGIPLELYAGWTLLWGILPQLAFPKLRLIAVAAIMALLDLIAMPLCGAVLHLGPYWLVGEAAAILFVLIPALCVARWTREDTHLGIRAAMQVALSAMLFLFVLPEIAFAMRPGKSWSPLIEAPPLRLQLEMLLVILLSIPGVGAVIEFVERGHGTPIPFDPPKRLVTSGIYRYCANPMQFSCVVVTLVWAMILENGWLILAAVMSLVYSAGIAEWDERQDLSARFKEDWPRYRASVHHWRLRWLPYHDGVPAQLYIAASCGPCSELQCWLERRSPLGLVLVDAATLPSGSIQRMRYNSGDGSPSIEGVRALGHALEHLHLGWALAGAALRMPGVWQFIQLVMDVSGLGPRTIQSKEETAPSPAHKSDLPTAKPARTT